MENKEFPQQEPEQFPTEEQLLPLMPEEELPVIQELSFEAAVSEEDLLPEEEPAFEAIPVPEEDRLSLPEEMPSIEALPVLEPVFEEASSEFPQEEPAFLLSQLPEEEASAKEPASESSFMDRIPDVEEDYPIPYQGLSDPAPAQELTPDDQAMDYQGMVPHGEPEPAFDLDILKDPAFAPAEPEPPAEDTTDQEYRDASPHPEESAAAPVPEKKKTVSQRPTVKGRPKRKKGEGLFGIPNILVTFVWLGLILAIGVTLGRMLWVCAADVLAFGRPDQKVTITVYEADTMEDIVDKLYENGLIRYKSLFNLYASISDAEEDIQPGIYDLNTRYDYHALVNFMSPSSTREVVELTIPEGYTSRQIYALLEENRVCTAVDIASYAADGELSDYWFLEGLERGSEYCLEGYLFPDTYQFYKNSSPREALEKLLDNFDYRFSEEMRSQIDQLNANVTDGSYTVREIVIVASLIEKESAAAEESPTIASVIYNRLFNWEYPALLNIDAAIVYAQGGDADTIDTSIDSPYNTYRYTGLTPTAIANPGLSSLKAALDPENTDYYFYVLNPATGMHQFSTTQEEHDAWIDEFYD